MPKTVLWVFILAVAYSVTAWASLQLESQQAYAASMWPAPALALVAALWWHARAWPGIWIGFLVINLAIGARHSGITTTGAAVAAGVALGSAAQAVSVAYHHQAMAASCRYVLRAPRLSSHSPGAAALSSLLAPTSSAISVILGGVTDTRSALRQWPNHWLGNLTSVLVFAPLLLQWREILRSKPGSNGVWKASHTRVVVVGISAWFSLTGGSLEVRNTSLPLWPSPCHLDRSASGRWSGPNGAFVCASRLPR